MRYNTDPLPCCLISAVLVELAYVEDDGKTKLEAKSNIATPCVRNMILPVFKHYTC